MGLTGTGRGRWGFGGGGGSGMGSVGEISFWIMVDLGGSCPPS